MQPVATSPNAICPKASYCQAAVTYLQFSIQVCFPCNDHAQPATPTVTDNLMVLIVVYISFMVPYVGEIKIIVVVAGRTIAEA